MVDRKAGRGARGTRIGSLAASSALVLALSFSIAWPLWSFATGSRRAFTLAVGAAVVLALLSFGALAALKALRGSTEARSRAGKRGPSSP
jgi:hypothetical protein